MNLPRALLFCLVLAPVAVALAADDAAARLDKVYDDYWEKHLELEPLHATQIGDYRFNDKLPNTLGTEHREKVRRLEADALAAAKKIGPKGLDDQARISYDLFVYDREMDLEGLKFPQHLVPVNQFYNFTNSLAILGSGSNAQPFKTVADYDAWLKRASQIPVLVDQAIANMREGMKQGVVQPKALMEKVLPQLDQQIVEKPQDSTYWGPMKSMPASFADTDKQRLTKAYEALISATLVPSYKKLRVFIADEYLPKCRDTHGLGAQPNGKAWYAHQVRKNTTTDVPPRKIHELGLAEVERIHGEMAKVMKEVGFEGSLKEFFEKVKSDQKQYFASEDELLAAYRGLRARVEPLLPTLFDIKPKADFEIRPVEAFRAASASSGQYNGPSQDGSRPGIFYVNTYDLKARPRFAMESLFLHEAEPGHHFQIALQRELTALPKFRRFGGETAFSEGWGLYAESLGKELGVYTDPYQYFGALDAELWRAIRLVADTGIHELGWTREKTLEYVYANSPIEQTRAVAEVERFMAIPGQALAYKMGQLKIRELRNRAQAKLGDKFDVRAFHTEVLKDGSLPLGILEAKIDRWIEEREKI